MIFSKTKEEHMQHLRLVFQLLRDNRFYLKLSKCSFMAMWTLFLGFYVGPEGIKPATKPAEDFKGGQGEFKAKETLNGHKMKMKIRVTIMKSIRHYVDNPGSNNSHYSLVIIIQDP
jgi:hypothetical protein